MTNPLLLDIPNCLDTPRLHIRCTQPGDGAAVHASIFESLAALRAWPASLPWAMAEPSLAASELFCRQGQINWLRRADLPMLLLLRDTGEHVGNCGLHGLDWVVPKCEIGFWVRSRFAGQGLITEAVLAVTAFAFEQLGMRRVQALADAANLASCRVCERAGYALEGTLRHERAEPGGQLRDTRVYARLR